MGEKLKDFFCDLSFYRKSYFSNPRKIKGKCKCCGECCKKIVFYVGENPICTDAQFELLKKWDKKYKNFTPNGYASDGAMYFKCRALNDDGRCSVYLFRSIACRIYPKHETFFFSRGSALRENCGYYIEQKKFKDFL